MMSTVDKEARITKLTNLRTEKKAGITKRITKLNQLIKDNASRSKIKYLATCLYECFRLLQHDCDELFSLMETPDSEWLEDVKSGIDECLADVSEYISAHQDDSTSSGNSFTDSWARKHAPMYRGGAEGVGAVADVTSEMEGLTLEGTESSNALKQPQPSTEVSQTPIDYDTVHAPGAWGNSEYWKHYFASNKRRFDPQDQLWKSSDKVEPPSSTVLNPSANTFYSTAPLNHHDTFLPALHENQFDATYNRYPPFTTTPYTVTFNSHIPHSSSSMPHLTSMHTNDHGIPSSKVPVPSNVSSPKGVSTENEVDSWIDDLDALKPDVHAPDESDIPNGAALAFFVQ